jgi:hypothetical protein
VVGLADDLHVGVLDAVVDHLDEVAGTVGADVGAAGGAVDLGGDVLEQRAQGLVGFGRATGHDRRTVEGALFAAGDPGADEVQTAGRHLGLTADRVGVERVAAVDDDVAGFHGVRQLADHRVRGLARLDHDEGAAGLFQGGDEVLDGGGGHEAAGRAELRHEVVGLCGRTVVHGDGVTVAGEVPGDVGAHHGQTHDTDLCGGFCHGAP